MFGAKTLRTTETVLAELGQRHNKLLRQDERFVAVCDAFGANEPHPQPLITGRRKAWEVPTTEELLRDNAEACRRVTAVQLALGMTIDQELGELPPSESGYVLAHTKKRLFVFDGFGKTYLLQAQIKGLWLQAVDHQDDMFTLVFHNDNERVAVATRRESLELTRAFVASFPDRRDRPRTITLVDAGSTVTF